MSKGMGLGGMSKMAPSPMASKMSKGMDPGDEDDGEESGDGDHSAKLIALGDILNNIHQISSDDLKPDIEEARKALMMKQMGNKDMPGMEMDEHGGMDSDDDLPMPPGKSGMDVTIGIGGKMPKGKMPGMGDADEDEEDPMMQKGGFMSLLAKRIKGK